MQPPLFGDELVSENVRAVDDLLAQTSAYRHSQAYVDLITFIGKFTRYSPYNAFLLYVQSPKVTFVATPSQWKKRHGRSVKSGARPLLILAPMHPILFVYDVTDTEGRELPENALNLFDVEGEITQSVWDRIQHAALKDGILATYDDSFSTLVAGQVFRLSRTYLHQVDNQNHTCHFVIQINHDHALNTQFATMVHELGHVYLGHLGDSPEKKWPARNGLSHQQVEIEAETVCYLVCQRRGILTKSAEYLAQLAQQDIELPDFSLDSIIRTAGRIENMGG